MCLHRGNNPQTVAVEVKVDGNEVISIEGDGVLISTSTGSTAYCLSAGGAVVHPDVHCFQVEISFLDVSSNVRLENFIFHERVIGLSSKGDVIFVCAT